MMTNVKDSAGRAAAIASEKLQETADAARAGLVTAKAKVSDGVGGYPVAAVLGGLAVGAVVGALLPGTKKEGELLGPIGGTITDRALSAVTAAREAGQTKLDELGLSTDAAGKQVGKLIESVAQVAEIAGTAVVDAIRKG
ncbi:MAG: hypothetical protein JWR77_970 [Rhizorhabdus sp.]|nr:hypothetical protein [Rhizorhabdus sp.]